MSKKSRGLVLLGALLIFNTFTLASTSEITTETVQGIYDEIQKKSPTHLEDGLTYAEMKNLYQKVASHPVAHLDKVDLYDVGGVGFCFGRAMTAHLIARTMGLPEYLIKKLFVIGEMGAWRFHVTTLVYGKETGEWYAIDPVISSQPDLGKPYTVSEWIASVNRLFVIPNGKVKFYQVPANVVIPDLRNVPDAAKETGKNIIELKFDPSTKMNEFLNLKKLGRNVYRVYRRANYFTSVLKANDGHTFDFIGITINGDRLDYHLKVTPEKKYFADLLKSILDGKYEEIEPHSSPRESHLSSDKSKYGMQFKKLNKTNR